MKGAHTERREIWPFSRATDGLDDVAFRVNRDGQFDSTLTSFELPADNGSGDSGPLTVEIQLPVILGSLAAACRVPPDSVELLVSIDHPGARTTRIFDRWSANVPKEVTITLQPTEYSPAEIIIRVGAVLARTLEPDDDRAWRIGSALSSRELRIYRPISSSLFKIENTSFIERKWDPAAWFVEFMNLEAAHEAPPEQVLTVHVNKDLEGLQMLLDPGASRRGPAVRVAAGMVRGLLLTGILADVTLEVLREFGRKRAETPDLEPDSGSMVEAVLSSLERAMGLPQPDLITLALENPLDFRRRVSGLKEITRAFGRESYEALLRGEE
jgi:hypothetical protein